MRRLASAMLVLSSACGSDSTSEYESACEIGLRIHGEALKAALDAAPECGADTDCVTMHETIACPGVVNIDLCDLAVHKSVPDLYDREAVAAAMCEATEGEEFGCSINAACRPHGEPECVKGACQFAD